MDVLERAYNFSLKTILNAKTGSNVANLFELCQLMPFNEHVEFRWLLQMNRDYDLQRVDRIRLEQLLAKNIKLGTARKKRLKTLNAVDDIGGLFL